MNLKKNKVFHRGLRVVLILMIKLKILKVLRFFTKNKLIILLYHGFCEEKYCSSSKHMSVSEFENHILHIKKHFNVVTLDQVYDYLINEKKLPKNPIAITFDDGYKNNINVENILKKYNVQVTVFVLVYYLGHKGITWFNYLELLIKRYGVSEFTLNRKTYNFKGLTTPQKLDFLKKILKKSSNESLTNFIEELNTKYPIKEFNNSFEVNEYSMLDLESLSNLDNNHFSIQLHGYKHNILSKTPKNQVQRDLSKSIDYLRNQNYDVRFFAYANGKKEDYNKNIISLLKNIGIKMAVTTETGTNTSNSDVFRLKRVSMDDATDKYSFLIRLYFRKYL